jgi:hypothetical protein
MSKILILDNVITEMDNIRSKLPRQHYEDDTIWDEVYQDFSKKVPNWFKLIGHEIPDIQCSAMSNKYTRYSSFIQCTFSKVVEIKQQTKLQYERMLKEEDENKIRQEAYQKKFLEDQAQKKKLDEYMKNLEINTIAKARLENEKREKLILAKMDQLRASQT